jgi:hypothetical protein
MTIDERVRVLGLVLPEPFRSPTGAAYPFAWVRVRGNRAYMSGHLLLQPDGTLAEPRGKVGEALTIEQEGGGGTAGRLGDTWQSSARAGRAGANYSLAACAGDDERRAWRDAAGRGHQRVLGSDPGSIRTRARSARAVGRGGGGVTYGVVVEVEAEVELGESARHRRRTSGCSGGHNTGAWFVQRRSERPLKLDVR